MDKIYITGAAGWLGKRMVKLIGQREFGNEFLNKNISEDIEIHCLVLPGQQFEEWENISSGIKIHEGDITNKHDCHKFLQGAKGSLLVHIAGIIHPKNVKEFYSINTNGTKNLLEAAAEQGVKRAVIMSSNSPIGCNPFPEHVFDEQSPFHPYMHYGKSKMEMEKVVVEIQKQTNLETVIIRAPWFYGPDQPDRQTLFFTMIKNGKGPIVGSGSNRRSMAYLDNLVQGLLLGAFHPAAKNDVFWIADERPYTMIEILDTIEYLLEKEFSFKVEHKRLKLPGLAGTIATIADAILQSIGLYHQKIHVLGEMNKTIACSVDKAKRVLGYTPHIALEEGMRRSIHSVIQNGQKI